MTGRDPALAAGVVALVGVVGTGCVAGSLPPSDARVAVMGRVAAGANGAVRFGYPGVTFRVRFEGPALDVRVAGTTDASRLAVMVDGGEPRVLRVARGEQKLPLAAGLPPGPHTVEIVHRTETWQGMLAVRAFELPAGGRWLSPASASPRPRRRLLFIGDSVTCGEAVDRMARSLATTLSPPAAPTLSPPAAPTLCPKDPAAATADAYHSYGMIIGRALDAEVHLVCYGGRGLVRDWRGDRRVANAPQFFDLAVVDPPFRAAWNHAAYVPDVVVLSLGTNDFNLDLGAFPPTDEYVSAYLAFLAAIRKVAPQAHLLLTEGAIVSDETDPRRPQRQTLRQILVEVARRAADPRIHVVPSRHYPGDACNAHPTGAEHAAMAQDLLPEIRRWLGP